MHPRIRTGVANHFPWLGRWRRTLQAVVDAYGPTRRTYAQHGEDALVLAGLRGMDLAGAIYVEVGAYHPSRLSNTYLLYRHGVRGVLVEPSFELARLLRWFRPEDVVVEAGCDARTGVRELALYGTPANNSFSGIRRHHVETRKGLRRQGVSAVPVRPLDSVLAPVPHDWICLLSIDSEGLDDAVLEGATEALRRTLYVCVECSRLNPDVTRRAMALLESAGFEPVRQIASNRLYRKGMA